MATHHILLPISIGGDVRTDPTEARAFGRLSPVNDWLPPVLGRVVNKLRWRLGWKP